MAHADNVTPIPAADWFFVETAAAITFAGTTLMWDGIGAETLAFADRPKRRPAYGGLQCRATWGWQRRTRLAGRQALGGGPRRMTRGGIGSDSAWPAPNWDRL